MVDVHLLQVRAQFGLGRGAEEALEQQLGDVADGAEKVGVQPIQKAMLAVEAVRDDGLLEALVPLVDVAVHEHDFGVRVGGDELGAEGRGRLVADGGAVAEELVPFSDGEGGPRGEVFGQEGGPPHFAVADVGVDGEEVVGFVVA